MIGCTNISTETILKRRHNNTEVKIPGLGVEVRNDDVNGALRKFKKKVQDSGILQELREREFYEKPTAKRKKAKAAARSRWLKKLSKEQLQDPTSRRRK